MTTHMVRKQIYIRKRQDTLLKRLSQARRVSEAEIIRQATASGPKPYHWNRDEIYSER